MRELSFKEKLLIFFGHRYIGNMRSKEIHDIKNLHHNCHIDLISEENKFYMTRHAKDNLKLIFDSCRWCMKEDSKD
jgi:hypothetical protein